MAITGLFCLAPLDADQDENKSAIDALFDPPPDLAQLRTGWGQLIRVPEAHNDADPSLAFLFNAPDEIDAVADVLRACSADLQMGKSSHGCTPLPLEDSISTPSAF